MKKFAIILFALALLLGNTAFCEDAEKPNIYENKLFGFRFETPKQWHLYGEDKFNKKYSMAIVDYGLPLTWSDQENQEIENSVSISAYIRPDIKSVDDLIAFEKRRINKILVSMEKVSDEKATAFVILTKIKGLEYKTKSTFIFNYNCGYIISFTATPGTYDKNLGLYHDFLDEIMFFEPKLKVAVFRKD